MKARAMTKAAMTAGMLVVAVMLVSAYGSPAPKGSGPVWATLSQVPCIGTGVEGMSVASIGNEIIAAVGHDNGLGDTATTRVYDIASDTWLAGPLAVAPGASSEGAGVAHGGLFYNIGGRGPMGPRTDIWSYDPSADVWDATLAPMSFGRAGLAVAVVGNSIYAIGGRTATGGPCSGSTIPGAVLDVVERYDIDQDVWTTVAPLPFPRSDLSAATVGGKIYVFGGIPQGIDDDGDLLIDEDPLDGLDNDGDLLIDEDPLTLPVGDVDVYDPQTDTWGMAPMDMPTARAGMYAVAMKGGSVFVIGGWDGLTPFDTNPATSVGSLVESYKVSKDTWTTGLPRMPTPCAETGAVDHGGRIFIVGGAQPGFGASVDNHQVFKP